MPPHPAAQLLASWLVVVVLPCGQNFQGCDPLPILWRLHGKGIMSCKGCPKEPRWWMS
jgi:hypothetical protein